MLTMAKHKQGEGTLKTFNPEVGRASQRKKMAEEDKHDEQEKNFHMVFYRMSEMLVVEPDYVPDSEVLAFIHVYTS